MVSQLHSEHAPVAVVGLAVSKTTGTRGNSTAMVETLPNSSGSKCDVIPVAGKQVYSSGILPDKTPEHKKTGRRDGEQRQFHHNRPLLRARRSLNSRQERCDPWDNLSIPPWTEEPTSVNELIDPPVSSTLSSTWSSSEQQLNKTVINTENRKKKRKSVHRNRSGRQMMLEPPMNSLHESSPVQTVAQYRNYHDAHLRPPLSHRHPMAQEPSTPRDYIRAEQRRERSRLAAQIRRNRESQSLMLLQNALPISSDVLGLHGALADASGLLSLFSSTVTDDEDLDEPDLEEDLLLLGASSPTLEPTGNEDCKLLLTVPSSPPPPVLSPVNSGPASAINLEKSDIIRIAGHTLFLLNHVHSYLGLTPTATLTLHSHSLYGLLIDTTDMRIVYVTPALAERIGWTWINLLGTPLRNVIQSNDLTNFSTASCCALSDTKSGSRRISPITNLYPADQECDSSSGIGTASTDATPSTMSSCSVSPLPPLPSVQPKTASFSSYPLPEFLRINRPTRVDSRFSLGNLTELGKSRRKRSRKKSHLASSSGGSRRPNSDSLSLALDDLGAVADSPWYSAGSIFNDASSSPMQIFHCWYTAIQKAHAPRLSTDHWSDYNSVSQPSSPLSSRQDVDDFSRLPTSYVDAEVIQQQQQQQQSSTGVQASLHDLLLCLLQPLVSPGRSTAEPSIAREELSHHSPNRGKSSRSRKPRSSRRRGSANAKQALDDHKVEAASNPDLAALDSLTESERLDSSNCDLFSQLSEFDLSSLNPNPDKMGVSECTCFSSDYCCSGHCCSYVMRLDKLGQILALNGVPDTSTESDTQSDLPGHSFLSLVHLDDLEPVIDTMNIVIRNCSIAWTPIYRFCTNTKHTETSSVRRYQWVRSLIQFVDDGSSTLICWHQPVGCAPTICPWNALAYEALTSSAVPEFRPYNSLPTSTSSLLPNSPRHDLSPTAKSSEAGNSKLTNKTSKSMDVSASPLDTLPLPASIKALRIVQMPEQKRWTIEIQSPRVPVTPGSFSSGSVTGKSVKTKSLGTTNTRGRTNGTQSHRTRVEGPRRRRKAPQYLRDTHHPPGINKSKLTQSNRALSHTGVGTQIYRFPCFAQLQQWYGDPGCQNVLVPSYSPEDKHNSTRKFPILIRRSPFTPTHLGTSTGRNDQWLSPVAETAASDFSHGSSTSTCPSPGIGTISTGLSPSGYPWLTPVHLPFVSTPLGSPTVEELAEAGQDYSAVDQSSRRETYVDEDVLQYDGLHTIRDDHELYVMTGETGAYVEV